MDTYLFFSEFGKRQAQFRQSMPHMSESCKPMMEDVLINTVESLNKMAVTAYREGLLGLEGLAYDMKEPEYIKALILPIVDGFQMELIERTYWAGYFSREFDDDGLDALVFLIYMFGLLHIAYGANLRWQSLAWLTLLPAEVSERYRKSGMEGAGYYGE